MHCALRVFMEGVQIMISVIMPALNAAKYIEKAMASVAVQTVDVPIELIVVDNGSEDDTPLKIRALQEEWQRQYGDFRFIVLLHNPTKGVSGSRNMGMEAAKGKYIAFLDADDWWEDTKLSKQLAVMEKDPDCRICATGRELVAADGQSLGRTIPVKEYITLADMERQNHINCSSVLVNREEALKFPMEHDDSHEDYIMWLRIVKNCGYARAVNEPLLKCRQSEDGKSRNKWKSAIMTWKVYRYIGYSVPKSMYCFVNYMFAGIRKYYG